MTRYCNWEYLKVLFFKNVLLVLFCYRFFFLNTFSQPRLPYTYDAFVCYNQEDTENQRFVQELIKELEGRRGFRLYVPGRDDVFDASELINNADQLERRFIIIAGNYFQLQFLKLYNLSSFKTFQKNDRISMLFTCLECISW